MREASTSKKRISADSLLAMNLTAARLAAGWTQEALSSASEISRATIAQLETGSSDPRLSTIEALGRPLGLTPALLIFGSTEISAIIAHARRAASVPSSARVGTREVRQLTEWVESGLLRERAEAVRYAAKLAAAGHNTTPLAVVLAAMFAAFVPDGGIESGAAIGDLISNGERGASASP